MLKNEYLAKEQALSLAARSQAEQLLARFEARAQLKTDAEFTVAAMQLTALANSGGSLVVPAGPGGGHARLPVRLAWFDDGLLIVRGKDKARDLAGATITAIDGQPISQIFTRLRSFFGGAEPRRRTLLPMMIEVPALMHAARLTQQPDRMRLQLRGADGRQAELELNALTGNLGGPSWWPDRWSSDGYDGSDWSYANPGTLPLYLADFESPFRSVPLAAGGQFVQLKWTPAWDRSTGLQVVEHAMAEIVRRPQPFVILDLRFDHGASSPEIAGAIAKAVAALPAATKVYLLVGRYTHHNGIATAAAVMRAGGARAIAIGEDMGDWLHGPRWAGRLCFKSVGICPTFSEMPKDLTQADLRRSPPFSIIPAPPTAASIRNGSDPALDMALRLERRPEAQSNLSP